MKNKKVKNQLKIYSWIGQVLSAFAGGIIGFVFAGPVGMIPGILLGSGLAHLLKIASFKAL